MLPKDGIKAGKDPVLVGPALMRLVRSFKQEQATSTPTKLLSVLHTFIIKSLSTGCQGAYIGEAMKAMRQNGGLSLSQFPYEERSCSKSPSSREVSAGQQYRIKGYQRLTLGGNNYRPDMEAIKQNLAQGAPVVIGMQVGGSFMRSMENRKVWQPTRNDRGMIGYSGHAMCVIGYDDNLSGGAFQLMNSWGDRWGENGIGWVRYEDFDHFVKEAYGLYPMGETDPAKANTISAKFGLVDNESQSLIYLVQKGSECVPYP